METILVNNDRKVTNAGIPADQLVKTFVIISAPPLSDIALVIYTACSLNIPAAVSRLTSFVIEVWPAVVGPTDEVACALGVRVTVALAHRAGRAVAALRPGRALIVGPDAVAVAPVMAVSLRAVLAG